VAIASGVAGWAECERCEFAVLWPQTDSEVTKFRRLVMTEQPATAVHRERHEVCVELGVDDLPLERDGVIMTAESSKRNLCVRATLWVARFSSRCGASREKGWRSVVPLAAAPPWFKNQGYPLLANRNASVSAEKISRRAYVAGSGNQKKRSGLFCGAFIL
jgi:hypothetical protein